MADERNEMRHWGEAEKRAEKSGDKALLSMSYGKNVRDCYPYQVSCGTPGSREWVQGESLNTSHPREQLWDSAPLCVWGVQSHLCVTVTIWTAKWFAVACVKEVLQKHFKNQNQSLTCKTFFFPSFSRALFYLVLLLFKSHNCLPFSPTSGHVQSLYGGKWCWRGEFTRCDQPRLKASSGICIHRTGMVPNVIWEA